MHLMFHRLQQHHILLFQVHVKMHVQDLKMDSQDRLLQNILELVRHFIF